MNSGLKLTAVVTLLLGTLACSFASNTTSQLATQLAPPTQTTTPIPTATPDKGCIGKGAYLPEGQTTLRQNGFQLGYMSRAGSELFLLDNGGRILDASGAPPEGKVILSMSYPDNSILEVTVWRCGTVVYFTYSLSLMQHIESDT